jgi:hypothetical protein
MKVFELLRNPLIKYPGIILVVYFGLFANKESPDSLGNRLSTEAVKKNFNQIQEKGKFIAANLQAAKDLESQRQQARMSSSEVIVKEDLEIGTSQEEISCGDEVEISYGIYDLKGKQLEFIEKNSLVVGSKKNVLIEQNIVGAKLNGIRSIKIPQYSRVDDSKLMNFLSFSNSDLKIQITILALKKDNGTSGINCADNSIKN